MKDLLRLARILHEQLGLTPYESRTYVSLLTIGPMSPSEIAQKANVPRPRTYDVLRSLQEKGLLVEQSGKPQIYASIDPEQGLGNLLATIEMEAKRNIEEKRNMVNSIMELLSQMYEKSKYLKLERTKVWFTQRDSAFISTYIEAIRNCEKELLVASTSPYPPEKEILEAIKCALRNGITVRVVRQMSDSWTEEDLENYEDYIKAGSQVKYLDVKEIPLRFMVFDQRDVILVFPSESEVTTLEALWLRVPPLAKILHEHFEELWKKGRPIVSVLNEIKRKKQTLIRKRMRANYKIQRV